MEQLVEGSAGINERVRRRLYEDDVEVLVRMKQRFLQGTREDRTPSPCGVLVAGFGGE